MASVDLDEKANFTRLSRLLVDKGTEALRTTFDAKHLPTKLPAFLNANRTTLLKLRPRVINDSQWDLLFPPCGNPPDSKTFDMTLVTILLRNICGLHPPATGWDTMPPKTDNTLPANITRIKLFRNQVYAHVTSTQVDQTKFDDLWQKISRALIQLKIPQKEIDDLKICPLGPDEEIYVRLLKESVLKEEECKNMLADLQLQQRHVTQITEETHRGVQQLCHSSLKQSEKQEEMEALRKLAKHNFKTKIRNKVKLFHPGTRDWLLNKVEHWFTTENESRLLLITAGPGFGKSVLAAKVSDVFREKGKLGACHFCDFSDSNLKDPMMMLQSLASHMCENIAGFKEKLYDQVNRPHKVHSLKDAFQIYLQNPLDELEVEPNLIVIDGLDESATEDKSEMVKLIANYFPDLPESVKVLITSRPGLSLQRLKDIQTIEIDAEDKENNLDLLRYLKFSLPSLWTKDMLNQPRQSHHSTDFSRKVLPAVVEKCEGSFLYAFHVQRELSKREDINTMSFEEIMAYLPEGMSSVYQEYFRRLEIELEALMNKSTDLFKLLEMLVAARKPLPLNFIARALSLDLDCRKVRNIINNVNEAVSRLLYVLDNTVTVFHKSVYDWLLAQGYQYHEYTVKVGEGNKWLWLVCEQVFNEIKGSVSLGKEVQLTTELTHALENGHTYLLECNMKDSFSWFVDMIVVHFLSSGYYQHFRFSDLLRRVLQRDVAMSLPLQQRVSWHYLEFSYQVRRSSFRLGPKYKARIDYLESVLDHSPEDCFTDCEKKIAETLLGKDKRFLERNSIVTKPIKSLLAKVFSSDIVAIGVSSNKKLAAVALEDGAICVLSLLNLVKLWQYSTEYKSISCCTFAPDDSFVLYGTLQTVLNIAERKKVVFFKGRVEIFKSCAFSPNGNRLVTVDASKIIKVWDVVKQSVTSVLDAGVPVDCCSFSKAGLFIIADKKNSSKGSYCVWNAITFQRVDQRRLSFRNPKHGAIKSEKCNRCFRQEIKELFPCKNLEIEAGTLFLARHLIGLSVLGTRESETSTGIYNGLDCIFSLNEHSLRIIDSIHFTTLAAWNIDFKASTAPLGETTMLLGIAAIEDDLWLYGDEDKLLLFNTSAPRKDRSFLSCLPRVLWCCFSPDGTRLATFTSDGFINLWNVDICQVYQRFQASVETSSGACWWSNNYVFVFHITDKIPSLSKYPVDENLEIMITQGKPEPLGVVVDEFLPFSGIIDFSEGFLSFECGKTEPVKVLDVSRIGHPKMILLPETTPMMSVAVSVGASVVLGVDDRVIVLWKRSEAYSFVYEVFHSFQVSKFVQLQWNCLFECCFSSNSKFAVVFFVTLDQRIFVVIEVNTGIVMNEPRVLQHRLSFPQLPKVFCTNTLVVVLSPLPIEIFDLKTLNSLGYSFQRNPTGILLIHSKLSPKGNVIAIPNVAGDMEFFQLNSPA